MPASETRFQTANMKSDPLLAVIISAIRSSQRQGYCRTKRLNNMERDNHFTQKLKSKYCINISQLLNKSPFTLRYVSQYSNTYNLIAQSQIYNKSILI